jgi:TRAP-type mannitol/chloroaromatic compound transport system permease large subunit
MHMYRGVIPFIMLQVVTLAICLTFPATITWLPKTLLGP